MKNLTSPRTLAECEFTLGYASVEHAHHRESRLPSVLLAVAIGIVMALAYANWWGAA